MKRSTCILFLLFGFAMLNSATAQHMTMQPVDVVVNSDGTEAVAEVQVTHSDGLVEIMMVHVHGSTFTTAGTSRLPGSEQFRV